MRHFFLAFSAALVLALPAAHSQTPIWKSAVQPTNPFGADNTSAEGQNLTVDAAGNQYVGGIIYNGGNRVFGNSSIGASQDRPVSFVAKLSATQQWLWASKVSVNAGTHTAVVDYVTTSPAGDVYASGVVESLKGSTLTIGTLSQAVTSDFYRFVTKLNASGQAQWIVAAQVPAESGAEIACLGWDAANAALVIAGEYGGTGVTFGSTTLPAAPYEGLYMARLSAAGQWTSALGVVPTNTTTNTNLSFHSAAVGDQGQVGLHFQLEDGRITLGSTVITSTSPTDRQSVVAQLSAAGQWQWATQPTNAGYYDSQELAYDPAGNAWLLGKVTSSELQLTGTTIASANEFVARLSAAGQWTAARAIDKSGSSAVSNTTHLAVDAQGNAVVSGILAPENSYQFGSLTLSPGTDSRGYVARLTPAGQWDQASLTPAGSYYFNDLAFDPAGNLLATGTFNNSVTFGITTLTAPNTTGNAFVARMGSVLNYDWANVLRSSSTYQDLGSTGTIISTANADDANSGPQNIGFAFPFNGSGSTSAATTFMLNTNGFIKLGSTPLSGAALFQEFAQVGTAANPGAGTQTDPFASRDERDVNILAPFATDLIAGTGGGTEYRVATTGTAPNRVCTIQWKNVRDKPRQATSTNTAIIGSQYDTFSFQLKLYETTGVIDFVYGPVAAGSGPDAVRVVAVGIKGSTDLAGDVVMSGKSSLNAWDANVWNSFRSNHNVRNSVLPDLGRTYRFRPSVAADATVHDIYTLGQLPIAGSHAAQASVRNSGTGVLTNVPVRLDVAGPGGFSFTNTQTIASLAPGQSVTVTFAPYTGSLTAGSTTVTVSLPNDTYASADRAPKTQTLTTNTFNYLPAGATTATVPFNYGFGKNAGMMAAKYNAARATTVVAVTNFIPSISTSSVGQTIYGLVLTPTGTILAQTPDYVVKSTDVGTNITLTFTTPAAIAAGEFLAGIAQRASTVEHYPVGALSEGPSRLGAAYDRGGLSSGEFNDVGTRNYGPFTIGAVISNTGLATTKGVAAQVFSVAPNPAHGGVRLLLSVAAPTAQPVLLLDVLGRPVRSWQVPARALEASLPIADLPRGLYIVRVGGASQRLILD